MNSNDVGIFYQFSHRIDTYQIVPFNKFLIGIRLEYFHLETKRFGSNRNLFAYSSETEYRELFAGNFVAGYSFPLSVFNVFNLLNIVTRKSQYVSKSVFCNSRVINPGRICNLNTELSCRVQIYVVKTDTVF